MWTVPVGVFNGTLQQYKAYEHGVVWPGKTMEVPADYFSEESIHLAILLSMTGSWDGGKRLAGAASLAIERVNNDKALLPGFRWQESSSWNDCIVRISYFPTSDPSKLAMAYQIVDEVTGCKIIWIKMCVCMCICVHVYTHVLRCCKLNFQRGMAC